MKGFAHTSPALFALLTILIWATPVNPQSKPPIDPATIQRKVQSSMELQKQALQGLNDLPQAEKTVWNAHKQLSSAFNDMRLVANTKSPDPVLDLNIRKAYQALGLIQQAGDALQARREGAAEVARDRLQQSLRITNLLLATGF